MLLADKVANRKGLSHIAVSAIWIRRIGDYVELLTENPATGEFVEIAREHFDGPFSHIVEPSGIESKFLGLSNAVDWPTT